jgi:succinate dehydrogenase / fumarate reductase cytochrome b subunit
MHILVTSSRAFGRGAWEQAMARVTGPFFTVGEFLVFAAFAFHAVNGIRLVLVELGFAVGKPIEPIYRSHLASSSGRSQSVRSSSAILAVAGALDFFLLGSH